MSEIKKWSKPVDWHVYKPGQLEVREPLHSPHYLLEKQMQELSYYHDGLITAVESIMDAVDEKESREIAMKFKEDFYGWQSFGTFYTGGVEMQKLFAQLYSHYWQGYRINAHWKRVTVTLNEIWEYLPVIYRTVGLEDINERYYLGAEPFRHFWRPSGLDDDFNIIDEKNAARWVKKFDMNTNLKALLKDWDTLPSAINSLEEYAKDLSSEMLREFTPDALYSARGGSDLYIEPPADYFGRTIIGNIVYYNIHNTLYTLTLEGYDVRSYWQTYKNAMCSIYEDTKKMYIRDWIADCNMLVSNREVYDPVEEIRELYMSKASNWIHDEYDPKNPFPFMPIPEDIE